MPRGDSFLEARKFNADTNEIIIWEFDSANMPAAKHFVQQEEFKNNTNSVLDVEVNREKRQLIQKVRSLSQKLQDSFIITRGVNPYDKYRGQSPDIINNKAYHADYKKDSSFVPELRGKHLSLFNYCWDGKHYISYGQWLAAPRDPKFFKGLRLLCREIIADRLICTLIQEDFVIDRSVYIALPNSNTADCRVTLGVLSSKLMIWLFKHEKNEFDQLFPKIRIDEFKNMPFPKSINKEVELRISELVDNAILSKAKDPKSDLAKILDQIDQLVYQAYGLTEEEISVMENND